jgi:hypothetical protein
MIARAATGVLVLVAIFLVPVAGRFGCSVGLAGGLLQFNERAPQAKAGHLLISKGTSDYGKGR